MRERHIGATLFGGGLAIALAAAAEMFRPGTDIVITRDPNHRPSVSPYAHRTPKLRDTKRHPGQFKGSSAAKRPARLAQKRAKASRRAVRRQKRLAAMFAASRAQVRKAARS